MLEVLPFVPATVSLLEHRLCTKSAHHAHQTACRCNQLRPGVWPESRNIVLKPFSISLFLPLDPSSIQATSNPEKQARG